MAFSCFLDSGWDPCHYPCPEGTQGAGTQGGASPGCSLPFGHAERQGVAISGPAPRLLRRAKNALLAMTTFILEKAMAREGGRLFD